MGYRACSCGELVEERYTRCASCGQDVSARPFTKTDRPRNGVSIDQVEAEIETLTSRKGNLLSNVGTLLITLLLFVTLGLFSASWSGIVILVVVILIHELGHFIGMKLFGYRDVRMFFIPLLGAAVAGSETNPSGARKAIVALLGPLPGLILGMICEILYFTNRQEVYAELARTFLFINAFNLLPLYPLDGARFLEFVLFSRSAAVELLFKLITGLALVGVAFALQSMLLGIFAFFVLLSLPTTHRISRIAQQLKRGIPGERYVIERVPKKYLEQIKLDLERDLKGRRWTPKQLATLAQTVWQRACHRPPRIGATIALVSVYFFSCTAGLLDLSTFEYQLLRNEIIVLVEEGDIKAINAWLETGGDPNVSDWNLQTPLMAAAMLGHREIVYVLLENGADPNTEDFVGRTVLIRAASNGHSHIVALLLDSGADVNGKSGVGRTVLMFAALNGHIEVVRQLLDKGADRNAKDEDGRTAMMLAQGAGHREVVELLR